MKTKKQFGAILNNESGIVLVVSVLMLAVLAALGTTAVMQTSTDLKISSNYKTSRQAFYDADAGVQYALAKIGEGLKSDPATFTRPSEESPATLTYTTPTGFSFTLSTISKNLGSDTYTFTSTGNGPNSAQAVIEATFLVTSLVPDDPDGALGMYGDDSVVTLTGGGSPTGPKTIDGKDYNLPTNFECTGSGCQGSVTTNAPVPGLYAEDTTPTVSDSHDNIDGTPEVKSGGGSLTEQDWIDFANLSIPLADNTNPTTTGSGTVGTRTAPEITVIDEDKTYAGSVDGAGILIIKDPGSAHFTGTFHWEGLIILLGGATVNFSGSTYIYGAIVMADYSSKSVSLKGTSNIMYSSEAISNLDEINELWQIELTSWKDDRN